MKTESEEYLGSEINLLKEPLSFFRDMLYYAYDLETKRQISLLEQTGRILVFISLLSATFVSFVPTIMGFFKKQTQQQFLFLHCFTSIEILLLISLIITLFSQWRYSYKTTPDILELKYVLAEATENETRDSLAVDYAERYIADMWESLKKTNDLRCKLVQVAMVILLIALVMLILIIIAFLFWR